MISSFRATGHASVRGTPVAADAIPGAWAPAELAMPAAAALPVEEQSPEDRAAAMVAEANERARVIDEAYARGLVDGERRAIAAGNARVNEAIGTIAAIAAQMREAAAAAPVVLEDNISALATIVARHIVARTVTVDRDIVADLVRHALTEFPIDQSFRIRVHPLDLALLTIGAGGAEDVPITGARDVTWFADPRIVRGGCMVEGRERIIDGRVDTALERAYRRMVKIDAA